MPFKSPYPDVQYSHGLTIWSWLFESLPPSASSAAVVDASTGERITYANLKSHAEDLSTSLVKDFDLCEGDVAILISPNSVWYSVAMHAVVRVGGTVAGSSPSSTAEEFCQNIRTSRARFIFSDPACLPIVTESATKVGIPPNRIILLAPPSTDNHGHANQNKPTIQQLVQRGRDTRTSRGVVPPYKFPQGKTNHDICAYLSFTSGTTGKPKACMLSHGNVIAQCLQMASITAPDTDKVLAVLPLYHITGLVHLLHLPIFRGADTILMPKFSMQAMLETIVRFQLRELILVPPLFVRLVDDPMVKRFDLSCVRRFSSGAAPLAPRVIRLLQERFPWTGFKQGYGMTESCSCLTAHGPTHYNYKYSGTVGTIIPSTELKFVDKSGHETEEGEILAKGPQCGMGYLENPQASREVFGDDGWLRTGDVGKMLPNGCVLITGRMKEIIKVKGVGVAPIELEELLLQHPDVRDVAVVGKPDSYAGERPHACVVLAEKVAPSPELSRELTQLVQAKKQRSKWIKGVTYVRSVPRAASGKILRRELQSRLDELRLPTEMSKL